MSWAPLLSSVLGWLLWCLLVGGVANRLPQAWLAQECWFTRPRPWGEGVEGYERLLGIRRWKGWLPDAGGVLPGGVAKGDLVRSDRLALERLVAETRRAELVHLALWPFGLATALWLPPPRVVINVLFATAFNLPCLWLQRYNRLRLQRILAPVGSRARHRPPSRRLSVQKPRQRASS